jgi:phage terminase small subunit
MADLTVKQEKFIEEYLIDLNGTQAAIRAGYNPNSANEQAARMLAKGSVASCVSKAMAERSKRTGVTQDRVLRELARLGFVNVTEVVNMDDATLRSGSEVDDTSAIASVKVKTTHTKDDTEITEREIKFHDKVKSLELLGKHLAMFTDNLNLKEDATIKIEFMNEKGEKIDPDSDS